jgi:hypothetical protein
MSYYRGWVFLVYLSIKGQLGARRSRLCSVREKVRPLLGISTRGCFHDLTHDLMVTRQQLYYCARPHLLKQIITITRIGLHNDIMLYTLSHPPFFGRLLSCVEFLLQYWEKAEFPFHAIPKLASLGVAGGTIQVIISLHCS